MPSKLITDELMPLFVDRLFDAVQRQDTADLLALIEAGLPTSVTPMYHSRTALMEAVRAGSEVMVKALLNIGAEVNQRESWAHATALHFAAESQQPLMVEILLNAGADVNAKTSRGKQPIHLLAEAMPDSKTTPIALETVDQLLCRAPALNSLDEDDAAPLHYCALHNNIVLAQRLLAAGANPNVQTEQGSTPLHIAMLERKFRFADLLYAYGAADLLPNHTGKTARDLMPKRPRYTPPERQSDLSLEEFLRDLIPAELLPA